MLDKTTKAENKETVISKAEMIRKKKKTKELTAIEILTTNLSPHKQELVVSGDFEAFHGKSRHPSIVFDQISIQTITNSIISNLEFLFRIWNFFFDF